MLVLALETSCDDTCAAVLEGSRIRSNVVSSQAELHEPYGGVVPEVASRRHLELVNPIVEEALRVADVDLQSIGRFAVTRQPGLIGALLIGVNAAKALASIGRRPLAGIDHLHGHVTTAFLGHEPLQPPFLCLVASGGHTLLAGVRRNDSYELLGETLDDAAGEALDKAARMLGLGYPGGPAIERAAAEGDPAAYDFPVAMKRDPGLDFSFSGLKTALAYRVRGMSSAELLDRRSDLAAAFQLAVVDQLVTKLERARAAGRWDAIALGGGVAANALLRARVAELAARTGATLKLVAPELCTDNAAMIGAAARFVEPTPYPDYLDWDAVTA